MSILKVQCTCHCSVLVVVSSCKYTLSILFDVPKSGGNKYAKSLLLVAV